MSAYQQEMIAIERLVVLPDRIEAHVRVSDGARCKTTPALASKVREAFPMLPFHACRNEKGPTFSAVIDDTSLPHLLEHLVIDIQTHDLAQKDLEDLDPNKAVFAGTTQWSAEDDDVAIVRVSFLDDLIALDAFKKAIHFINTTLADPRAGSSSCDS